jgi:putative intracellular protease/amidase
MTARLIVTISWMFIFSKMFAQAATEDAAIRETVWNYIEGRNSGDSIRLKKAFYADALLRFVNPKGELMTWKAQDYIARMSTGKKQDCTGEILEVKYFNDAAQATVILKYPNQIFYDYLNLLKVNGTWLISDKIFAKKPAHKKVLFVVTSHAKLGETGKLAGVNLKEVSYVYKALADAGYTIDFVSPKGGVQHVYGHDLMDSVNVWFLQQKDGFNNFMNAHLPSKVNAGDYKAIYFAGGHGTMWDFPNNPQLTQLAAAIYSNNGVVAALCHGPSGILDLKVRNGDYLVKGKRITGYTDAEEKQINLEKVMPFLLEAELKKRGAMFASASPGGSHVEVDDRLITGQNPQSAAAFAEAFLRRLGDVR